MQTDDPDLQAAIRHVKVAMRPYIDELVESYMKFIELADIGRICTEAGRTNSLYETTLRNFGEYISMLCGFLPKDDKKR